MGYFMDRHELGGEATAADIAAAHLRDLEIQDRHGVQFLSYWFDYERHSAFCLVEAPDAESAQAVHREAHGRVANRIIPVDPAEVRGFMGRVDDPLSADRPAESGFRVILFTDIAGSTEMVQRMGDHGAMEVLRSHDAIVRGALAGHGGREVKHTGDGIMASFSSVVSALAAAARMQEGFAAQADERPDAPLLVRIGISAGEPVAEGEDLFGAVVQLAARLTAHAEPGSVIVSSAVRDLAMGKPFRFAPVEPAVLRGFAAPVDACLLEWRAG